MRTASGGSWLPEAVRIPRPASRVPRPASRVSAVLRLRIDADPVVPDVRPRLLSQEVEDDEVGRLERHVAVDAAPGQCRVAALGKETAALHLVAGETAPGELGHVALRAVDVVAGEAGHLRRAVAR